jgi:hypothetical protein
MKNSEKRDEGIENKTLDMEKMFEKLKHFTRKNYPITGNCIKSGTFESNHA